MTRSDDVATDRFGRRARAGADDGSREVVAFYTPEGQRLWERLQSGPPTTAVTSEEFAAIVAANGGPVPASTMDGAADRTAVPAAATDPADLAEAGDGTDEEKGAGTDTTPDPAATPEGPHPWLPAAHSDRRLAAWRLSGRGSLDAPTDD